MAGSQSVALRHWTRIIQRWPVDKVRPENISFQKRMQVRLDQYNSSGAAIAAESNAETKGVPAAAISPPKWNENQEMQQANALYSLLEDRYMKLYPMPQNLRMPKSNPTHYDDLAKELQEAPTRSWFGGVVNRLKGSLRLS